MNKKRKTAKDIKGMFIKNERDDYGKRQYRKYLDLSSEERRKIRNLKNKLGKKVMFRRGETQISEMIVMAVTLPDKTYKIKGRGIFNEYKSYPYQFRLNYVDYETNKERMWDGLWTTKINNITFVDKGVGIVRYGKKIIGIVKSAKVKVKIKQHDR